MQHRVSIKQRRLTGEVVVEWSNLEHYLELLILDFLDFDVEKGRLITTRLDASSKIQTLRALAKARWAENVDRLVAFSRVTDAIDGLREDRNF